MTAPLRIALGQYDTGWHEPESSLARAESIVRAGAAAGARLVVLPEMCTTGFTMDASQAERRGGRSERELARVARASSVHVLAGIAAREDAPEGERAVNMALLSDQDGRLQAEYRKQRVFAYAGEDVVYAAGRDATVTTVHGVRLGFFVCYDLRFPELFRAVARDVDAVIVIANWPAARRAHWDALLRARAIENQCYVVGVNRVGTGGGIVYDGGSAAFDPWGESLALGAAEIGCVDVDPARVAEIRSDYPFLRDFAG